MFVFKISSAFPTTASLSTQKLVAKSKTNRGSIRHRIYAPVKRIFDIVGATALLIATSPVMLVAAVAVRLSSPGPAIYSQRRLTQGGKVFTMYKFRSMANNAEKNTGAVWATTHDPRVTPLGRFLRNSRIDELPQLVNVLKGEMSLIGPRPERPELVERLSKEFPSFHRRMEVKGCITGLAQTFAEYASCFDSYKKKLALDLLYVKRRCLLLDMRIAFQTVFVMLTGRGAH